LGRRPRTAGPYRRLTPWLAEHDAFKDQARVAERLGLDPVTVLREPDWQNRAIRTAAAAVAWRDDDARAKAQNEANKK
jgi:hypothetical protein